MKHRRAKRSARKTTFRLAGVSGLAPPPVQSSEEFGNLTSLYERWVLPRLLTAACSSPPVMQLRREVVPLAEGRVLELGVGLGLNLAFYDPTRVSEVVGIDPASELRQLAMSARRDPRLRLRIEAGGAEDMPFEDASFDSVVCTFTLCSVCAPPRVLAEVRRVLKPGGRLLFCEHGLAPDPGVVHWQHRLEPFWKRMAGGCHLTRPVGESVRASGFRVGEGGSTYLPKAPKVAGWCEWGVAQPR